MSPGTLLLLCSWVQNTVLRRFEKVPWLLSTAILKISVKNDMRLQLKLGRIATKSKDGTHLLRVDVCQATTSIRAQARFMISGEKLTFPGDAVPCSEVDASGRLEGSHLSNPCWRLLTMEEARRDQPKDGRCRDVSWAGLPSPSLPWEKGRFLWGAQQPPQPGPPAGCPLTNLEHCSSALPVSPPSEVKIDTAK